MLRDMIVCNRWSSIVCVQRQLENPPPCSGQPERTPIRMQTKTLTWDSVHLSILLSYHFHFSFFIFTYLAVKGLWPERQLSSPSLSLKSKIQVQSLNSKIQSPEERYWDVGWLYNLTCHHHPTSITFHDLPWSYPSPKSQILMCPKLS